MRFDDDRNTVTEDYLRAIYEVRQNTLVTQAELARRFDVSRATVCNTVARMRRDGLIEMDALRLTDDGLAYAQDMTRRFNRLVVVLEHAGMTRDDCPECEADRLEHCISDYALTLLEDVLP